MAKSYLIDPTLAKFFSTMMLALVGLELAPLMGSEIRDPRRVLPRAMVAAGTLIVAFYLLGTAALLVALPKGMIDSVTGIPEGVFAIAARLGLPALGPITALLMTIASVGVLAAWITGGARLPYVVGIDRHLPGALGRLHSRWYSPHIALLASGFVATVLSVLALAGSTVGDAYQTLVDMTIAMTFIPLAYMFASLPRIRGRCIGDRPGLLRVPGGRFGVAVVS